MKKGRGWSGVGFIILFISTQSFADLTGPPGVPPPPGVAAPPPGQPWKDTGEVSLLSTTGNSRTTTTSVKNEFAYTWATNTLLDLTIGGTGSSSGSTVTNEQYNAGEKVEQKLTDKVFAFERLQWDKNRFAGIRNRYDFSSGLGRVLLN